MTAISTGRVLPNVSDAEHRRRIRRRQRVDLLFSVFGCSLVIGSLAVLVALFSQLLIDGAARLSGSHFVKQNGFAPGVREIVGTIVRSGADPDVPFAIQLPELHLSDAGSSGNSDDLSALAGRR